MFTEESDIDYSRSAFKELVAWSTGGLAVVSVVLFLLVHGNTSANKESSVSEELRSLQKENAELKAKLQYVQHTVINPTNTQKITNHP